MVETMATATLLPPRGVVRLPRILERRFPVAGGYLMIGAPVRPSQRVLILAIVPFARSVLSARLTQRFERLAGLEHHPEAFPFPRSGTGRRPSPSCDLNLGDVDHAREVVDHAVDLPVLQRVHGVVDAV